MVSLIWRPVRRALPVIVLIVLIYAFYDPVQKRREEQQQQNQRPLRGRIPYSAFVKTGFDWSRQPQRYPVPKGEIASLPRGRPRDLPDVQFRFPDYDFTSRARARERVLQERRDVVRSAFVKSWTRYKTRAWMYDEVTPVSGIGKNPLGGWAATLVDSLDSLWLMDMKDDFYIAATAVAALDWSAVPETSCSFFDTTVRHLGGLLSAYDLSGETVLLHKAVELGNMLYMAFDTPGRMPSISLDFEKARTGQLRPGTRDPSASIASSSLEFTRLARLTGDDKYYDAIDRVTRLLDQTQNATKLPGMWPAFMDLENKIFNRESDFTLGAFADSLYELLPKMYALLGGLEPVYEKLYRDAMDTVKEHLLFRPSVPDQPDILFTGRATVRDETSIDLQPEVQHLACFGGAMFALGGRLLDIPSHIETAEKLTRGCVWAYEAMPAGIMPERMDLLTPCPASTLETETCTWSEGRWKKEGNHSLPKGVHEMTDPRHLLRPEAIESVFTLYRVTGNEEYQEMAWRMFMSLLQATETELGFSAISDVNVEERLTEKIDLMPSFWLSGTLKYFYLVFSPPDLLSLDRYVFNTEAHPLKRP
ncbi:glycoside hydrolase family 47 protein [Poronia punctata]|nr:glycoside hydrolase family 47 protein [Poronia punctata]